MNQKEMMRIALEGGVPDTTPYSIYDFLIRDLPEEKIRPLTDMGLGITVHRPLFKKIEHGVKRSSEEKIIDGDRHEIYRVETPVGTLENRRVNGWRDGHLIHSDKDYLTMKWIIENTEVLPDYEPFLEAEGKIGNTGIVLSELFRTPMQTINIDIAGTERFCMDIASEVPELFELYEALRKHFRELVGITASGPGRYVKILENLSIEMLGPERYRNYLLPVYNEIVPILHGAGKKVMVHYDGALNCIREDIASAPFDMIESLTEAPEGDMTYSECRQAWPDKIFWANINVGLYYKPLEELENEIARKYNMAGKKGLLFEISEDRPANWETTIPFVLKTIEELE